MNQPGFLNDLTGDAAGNWARVVQNALAVASTNAWSAYESALRHQTPPATAPPRLDQFVADGTSGLAPGLTRIDWPGFPIRVQRCLDSTSATLAFLDQRTAQGDLGRYIGQEEYLEWRIVRDDPGRVIRMEITTETQEYWQVVAAAHPERVLQLCGEFAGSSNSAPAAAVFGALDPFAPGVTAEQREAAFASQMAQSRDLPPSPYNNGIRAICFLGKRVNSLRAAVELAAHAARPYGKRIVGGGESPLTGPEAIATGTQQAVDCRNSDPTIVGKVLGLAWQGKRLALADPVGIYISSVDFGGLRDPDGNAVARDWFTFSRGQAVTIEGSETSFFQRLVVAAPAGSGLVLGDLSDANGDPITAGAQVARLVTIALYARASADDAVVLPKAFPPIGPRPDCANPTAGACAEFTSPADVTPGLAGPGGPATSMGFTRTAR